MRTGDHCRGRRLLLAQADRGPPLGAPPAHLSADAAQAWYEILEAVPLQLSSSYGFSVDIASCALAGWRRVPAGSAIRVDFVRLMYRLLGEVYVPMAARRRLLYGNLARPSRSRRA